MEKTVKFACVIMEIKTKKVLTSFLLILALFSINFSYSAEWTILNYIEANNNVAQYALTNIEKMKLVGSTNDVNILVNLNLLHKKKTIRLHVLKNSHKEESVNQEPGINHEKELVEAVSWAYQHYPAKKFALILWNHGNGILDQEKSWKDYEKRGILYNFIKKTYLNNQQLTNALNNIKNNILKKNIDLLGMDACVMGMIEVAFQINGYVDYFVSSQHLEIAPGWDYKDFLTKVTSMPTMSSLEFSKYLVSSFAKKYASFDKKHTLSCIDIRKINDIEQAMIKLSKAIENLPNDEQKTLSQAFKKAFPNTMRFDELEYIDFVQFFQNIALMLQKSNEHYVFNDILLKIENLTKATQEAIIFHKQGTFFKNACGLSIYFPEKTMHESYKKTLFYQNTGWDKILSIIQGDSL
jgi:hypothetical protein